MYVLRYRRVKEKRFNIWGRYDDFASMFRSLEAIIRDNLITDVKVSKSSGTVSDHVARRNH